MGPTCGQEIRARMGVEGAPAPVSTVDFPFPIVERWRARTLEETGGCHLLLGLVGLPGIWAFPLWIFLSGG